MQASLHTTYAVRMRCNKDNAKMPESGRSCYDLCRQPTLANTAIAASFMPDQQDIVAEIPRLRRYARALTGDTFRAEDLVQDTIERALSRWVLWQPGNLRAWLFTIMHNVFINQIRANKQLEFRPDDLVPEIAMRAEQEDGLALRDLDRALQHLPVDQRETLLLVTLEELSYEEAARVLGVPIGTVMSRLYRARERLRQALHDAAGLSHLKVVK